jgi:uncharacterized alpha-E superfamily protein
VLSRVAESLYWIGRYIERAEDTARILDVHYHLMLEDRRSDEADLCRALLDAMGAEAEAGDAPLTAASVSTQLAFDVTFPGSISSSLSAAWENARGAREAISSELWESLNATHRQLAPRASTRSGGARKEFFDWVRERTAVFNGLVEASLSRDDGYRFLVLGRSLERADMTGRLLSARYHDAWGQAGWTTTLRSCSAHEAFLRTYRQAVDGSSAIEFLLLDRLFPRSIFHSLNVAARRLGELDPSTGSARAGVGDDAQRQLGRLVAELEFLRADDILDDLPQRCRHIQDQCAEVHAAIAARYFRETRVIEWSV